MRLLPSLVSIFLFFANFLVANGAVLGIDFGNENLKAMIFSPKASMEMVLTPESKRKDVSGLAIKPLAEKGAIERVFGSSVNSLVTRLPKNSLLHLKSLMGKTIEDEVFIKNYIRSHPGVNITRSMWNGISFEVNEVEYPIEELVAMNFQEIRKRSNQLLKEKDATADPITSVALTVPEYFDQNQREALLNAMSLTTPPLDTILISDGVSIINNFVLKQRNFASNTIEYYAIYDMGSSATKASLFSVYQPKNSTDPIKIDFGGYGVDLHLGGSTFTMAIADLIENKFLKAHPAIRTEAFESEYKAKAKIIQAAKKAKLILSANSEATVSIESIFKNIDFRTTISRKEFESFAEDIISDSVAPLRDMFKNQFWSKKINMKSLKGVLLAGGGNRIPAVQEKLSKLVGEDRILRSINADEASINGATVRGIKLANAYRTKDIEVTERTLFSYSALFPEFKEPQMIFEKGEVYPNTKSFIIQPCNDNPSNYSISLFEHSKLFKSSEVEFSAVNTDNFEKSCSLGVAFNVSFSLSQNREFDVSDFSVLCLNDTLSKKKQKKPILLTSNDVSDNQYINKTHFELRNENAVTKYISKKEFSRLKEHIRELDRKDMHRLKIHELRNQLEELLYASKNLLDEEGVALNEVPSDVEELSNAVPEQLEWLESTSDSCSKVEVTTRIELIKNLKSRIEKHLKTRNEPLDVSTFKAMANQTEALIKAILDKEGATAAALDQSEPLFKKYGMDIAKEYDRITFPPDTVNDMEDWDEVFENLKDNLYMIKYILKANLICDLRKEQLFDMKISLNEAYEHVSLKLKSYVKSQNYRLEELQNTFLRQVRSIKRREQRRLEKDQKLKVSLNDTTSINLKQKNKRKDKLPKSSLKKKNSDANTDQLKSSSGATIDSASLIDTSSSLLHDEL